MIPVIIWNGTQTGSNALKCHLRLENNETIEYRNSFKDEIISLLNDESTIKRIENGQWAFKYILQHMNTKDYDKIFEKNMVIRIPHGPYLSEYQLSEILKSASKYNYGHLLLYRESPFTQAIAWYHEDFGKKYEQELPVAEVTEKIKTIQRDLFYTYNYIKDKIKLNVLSYESFFIRREKQKVKDALNSVGFDVSLEKVEQFIFGRFKHLVDGDKFKIDEVEGPICETIKHSYKKNFDLLNDMFCEVRVKI